MTGMEAFNLTIILAKLTVLALWITAHFIT